MDDITLNLSLALSVPVKKHKRHVKGIVNRKKRIEARRKLKKRILKFGEISSKGSNESIDMENDNNENGLQAGLSKTQNQRSRTLKSKSIFSGNPDIPELNLTKLRPETHKDSKFSGDKFSNIDIHSGLKAYIVEKMELEEMTPVQSLTIPLLFAGHDALIRSQTGSGKTLAYALPIIQSLQAIRPEVTRQNGPLAIVLTPTRELTQQSFGVFQQLTLPIRRIVASWFVGGVSRKSEKARVRKGINILVSTPGRFVDHLENTSCLTLENVKWLVFDEADRLLDMGFQKDINRVLKEIKTQCNEKPQIVLLSATLNKGVENLVDLALSNPRRVDINEKHLSDNSSMAFVNPSTGLKVEKVSLPEQLKQRIVVVPTKLRLVTLLSFIMKKMKSSNLLVFLSCRDSVEFHCQLLKYFLAKEIQSGMEKKVLQLHGGMMQAERTEVVTKFKKSNYSVLLCTDVAARGLDFPHVNWVVQYTSPGSPADYIHRVGRTARAGKNGNAILFLTPVEAPYVKLLGNYDIAVDELKVDDILVGLLSANSMKYQENLRLQLIQEKAAETHRKLEAFVSENKILKECASSAFLAFVRAYATYPSTLKHIFHVKNLHIGHVAKSFALQDTPNDAIKHLQRTVGQKAVQQMQEKKLNNKRKMLKTKQGQSNTGTRKTSKANRVQKPLKRHPIVAKFDLLSEFSSGIEEIPLPKRMKSK